MAIVLTWIARVTDWRALQRLNRETLLDRAREAGARRYQLYRNVKDASQLLVVAELLDYEAAHELGRAVEDQLGGVLIGEAADDRMWEATGLEGID